MIKTIAFGLLASIACASLAVAQAPNPGVPIAPRGYIGYNEFATASVANGGPTSVTYRTAPAWASYFNCRALDLQSGTLYVSQTIAGSSAQTGGSQALTATVPNSLRIPISGVLDTYACYVVQGSTTGSVTVESSFTAN